MKVVKEEDRQVEGHADGVEEGTESEELGEVMRRWRRQSKGSFLMALLTSEPAI